MPHEMAKVQYLKEPGEFPDQCATLADYARMLDSIQMKNVLLEDLQQHRSVHLQKYALGLGATQLQGDTQRKPVYLVYCSQPGSAGDWFL